MAKRFFKLILLFGLVSFVYTGTAHFVWAGSGHDHHDKKGHSKQKTHKPHSGHDDHKGHDKPKDGSLRVEKSVQKTAGFKRAKVQNREIKSYIEATGLIELNHDVSAHIIPRIPGRIYKVLGHLGDTVKKGQPLIIIDSLEMSKAKSNFLVECELPKKPPLLLRSTSLSHPHRPTRTCIV